ncbi:hypothetical protein B0T25DRAFT_535406 [Lasiosphaeria hispida]|uniref:Uncharacterized protein n=1 Tax=Lasiosphaeria hispida TaxID=260671 RepID=A0AAJ0MIS6_9PEZI|nr:hypothetical protein B0T25DRAFT_535406 [Lasiosphaeria hispida]
MIFPSRFTITTTTLVYGAIHAAAWNGHFPTSAEEFAWKVSCVYVAGYGCVAMGFGTIVVGPVDRGDLDKSATPCPRWGEVFGSPA